MAKGSRMYSVVHMKCPRCHEGDVFVDKNMYNLKKTTVMLRSCPNCGLNYYPEPGFYFGAGYVSYAIAVAISLAVFGALLPFVHWEQFEIYIGAIGGAILITAPLNFRLSRIIWLNFFNHYQPSASKTHS